jgi:serine phosphatase RsbU (regulator of sigma subunit)/succinate dehydrogenase flavin-adding protein (antitoxin of CptAB toxin-antitoxin module)
LVNLLPDSEKDFADVWKTYVTPDGIYFQTFSKLVRVKNNTVKIWKPKNTFHFSFFVNNTYYINEKGIGLKKMNNDQLQLTKGGGLFAGMRIYSMLSYSPKEILIATRENGLFLMNNSTDSVSITPIIAEANERLINDQVYGGVALDNKKFGYATLLNGVLIIDSKGNIIQCLNKKNGLQDDIVKFIGLDNQHDLWIALGKGVSHAEISSPLSSLTEAHGINGTIENIIKHKGNMYLATSSGLFVSQDNYFLPIKGLQSTWSLLQFITKTDTLLLASTESGVFKVNGSAATLIKEGFAYTLYQSKKNSERIYVGMYDGLSSIRFENQKWMDEGYINGIDKDIRNIVEDLKGNLWLGTPVDGLIKINFTYNSNDTLITSWKEKYSIQYLDTTNGLPTMDNNIPYQFKNKIVFGTNEGIYEFDEGTSKFLQSSLLKKELSQTQVYRFASKDSSTIYMFTVRPDRTKETGIAYLQKEGFYKWYTKPFRIIKEREIYTIFPDENNITWLGGPDGLLRYDAAIKKDFSIPYYALIRKIRIGKDSTLFGGNFYISEAGLNTPIVEQLDHLKPVLQYIHNSLTFDFSATNYSDEQNNKFSYYLEGHDNDWSQWSTKKDKEYSDLREGSYIFHVKAKNIYGTESIESSFSFTILPPWYRTIWAYITYVLLIIGLIYLIIRLSIRRLVKAKNQLEKIVKERTAEVVEQKHLIEEKHKEITDSINYAERIQRSFLATKDLLDENLKDYFVFFKPKDVVSGDFYWAQKLNNENFVLATADSTGHGVPGAIMSLLNITSLEKAIEYHHEPADILNYTRQNIIERLKKDGSAEGGKDGMDASLIVFDFLNRKLSIAAANNPVWIVRRSENTETELIEVKPEKMPVGKHDKQDVPFTQQELLLQSGDVVYTLTDGFPDQFGGEKGKKFMSKNLKELLAANSHLPMQQLKDLLLKTFNDWVGNLEQIDDVTIIGVRIQ